LVTLDQSVPQGAPSSPVLSNAVCFPLDCAVTEISQKHGLRYTRYADDFAFSGDAIPTTFASELSAILDINGFGLNHEKTRLYGPTESVRFLTGLVLTPDRIRPPKRFRRWIRQRLFYLERFMVTDLDAPKDVRDKSELLQNAFLLDSLRGKIGYWTWVDPLDVEAQNHLSRLNRIDSHLVT
jgi:RNA-directed DNA polymerase